MGKVIAQRNVIAHGYGELKWERIRVVLTRSLPELLRQPEPLIPEPPTVEPDE